MKKININIKNNTKKVQLNQTPQNILIHIGKLIPFTKVL